ncbi:MAG: hypothetical protein QOG72_2453 [Sphingomonadales bacterium]|jgi:hypothetical protein|nr:hypothetical protein [Sphingomonadales bacterium]
MANQAKSGRPDNNRRLALLERRSTALGAQLEAAGVAPAGGEDVFDAAIRAVGERGSAMAAAMGDVARLRDVVETLKNRAETAEERESEPDAVVRFAKLRDALAAVDYFNLGEDEDVIDGAVRLLGELGRSNGELRGAGLQVAALGDYLGAREGFALAPGEGVGDGAIRLVEQLDAAVYVRDVIATDCVQILKENQVSNHDETRPTVMIKILINHLRGKAEAAEASLRAQKGAATKARQEVAVLRLERSPTPRKIGRRTGLFGKAAEPYDPAAARAAIDAGEVEIVFSDGREEIVELAPVSAAGDAWQRGARGYALRDPILLEPGEIDAPELRVAGFGILAGGEQIGWRELPDDIVVPRNGRVLLENTIVI